VGNFHVNQLEALMNSIEVVSNHPQKALNKWASQKNVISLTKKKSYYWTLRESHTKVCYVEKCQAGRAPISLQHTASEKYRHQNM